jgi:hypothetical protein
MYLTLDGSSSSKTVGLARWLDKHGGSDMRSITLTLTSRGSGEVGVDLPFHQLQGLRSLACGASLAEPRLRSLALVNSQPYRNSQDGFEVLLQCRRLENTAGLCATVCTRCPLQPWTAMPAPSEV